MSELSHYIKLRSGLSGCNAKQFECDKYLDCDSCLEDKIKEHDKQIRAEAINDYYRTLNEKINTDTRLKETIKDIHDNVAQEMYCKGIDDFAKASRDIIYNYYTEQAYIKYDDFCKIAKQLKKGIKNEN